LVPVDNSPAQWAFGYACVKGSLKLADIRQFVDEDMIPVAMILQKKEKAAARFRCTLGGTVDLNSKGWKLAHIRPVGLGSRTPLSDIPLNAIVDHFRRLMSPSNMFVVPKQWAGLAEPHEFVQVMAEGVNAV
jgi:hypothetical protein